ncbi:DUF368 domain-containing protein [Halalkalicoccus subterraneus]|uniref:DUF368 domain-containing protein n=1 Tax=Halalkalicoccus subterraneus TaxID=2675002 RepID=UPI000EFC9698|nr:DUF368 domain-containing protein [Halalkalicoccus subterraneus]
MREWLSIYLKGVCMGAADIVPGVSGGTIALIAGIYDRLIAAIAALDPRILATIPGLMGAAGRARFRDELVEMDVPFLLVLGAGVGTAVVLMAQVIEAAFAAYPAVLNGFFFGLIAASAVVIYRITDVDTPGRIGALAAGALIAFLVTGVSETGGRTSLALLFVAGMIAISAMVLPGISGSAFLYILGIYQFLIGILGDFTDALIALPRGGSLDAVLTPGVPIAVFLTGATIGLLTMARIVERALERNRMATLGFLVGLMVGALRMPVREAADATEVWTTGLIAAIVAAVVIGAAVVLGFDYYTDSLDYTEDTAV